MSTQTSVTCDICGKGIANSFIKGEVRQALKGGNEGAHFTYDVCESCVTSGITVDDLCKRSDIVLGK